MKCPHCGMDIKPNTKTCPYCYGVIECGDHDECESGGSNKLKKFIIAAAVVLCVGLAAFFLLSPLLAEDRDPDAVTARYGSYELSNREFNYYFWNDYYYHQSNYGGAPTDFRKLKTEKYDETTTWQDYFTDSALRNWRDITVVSAEAAKNNHTLPENYQNSLDSLYDDLTSAAGAQEFETVDDYLRHHYGPEADFDSYKEFLTKNYFANSYADGIYRDLYNRYAEEISHPSINVRHILIKYGDYDTNDDAKAWAEQVYQLFKDDPTEDNFAELANRYSTDDGSNTQGGIYVNVCQGDMVEQFDAWCFDPDRQAGDNGIVETVFGYHIMYFCGTGSDMTSMDDSAALDQYYIWLNGLTAGNVVPEDEAIQIYYPDQD